MLGQGRSEKFMFEKKVVLCGRDLNWILYETKSSRRVCMLEMEDVCQYHARVCSL